MPKCSNPYGGAVASALHLRKSRNSCCRYCIRLVPVNTQQGISTAAGRRRSGGRSASSEDNILLREPVFPRWRREFLSDRESHVKRRHRNFVESNGIASLNRSNGSSPIVL